MSSLLSAGDVSTTSRFDSGADLVLLGVQAFINTNTPATDLILSKTHAGDFNLNQENDFILTVTNNEGAAATGVTTVGDTLPAGLDFVSAVGAGWTCSFSAPNVTCTSSQVVSAGNAFPCLLYTSPSPRDRTRSRMPSSA